MSDKLKRYRAAPFGNEEDHEDGKWCKSDHVAELEARLRNCQIAFRDRGDRIKELETFLEKLVQDGSWYASAIELDTHRKQSGEELCREAVELLYSNKGEGDEWQAK